jgi:hypothetical protein
MVWAMQMMILLIAQNVLENVVPVGMLEVGGVHIICMTSMMVLMMIVQTTPRLDNDTWMNVGNWDGCGLLVVMVFIQSTVYWIVRKRWVGIGRISSRTIRVVHV